MAMQTNSLTNPTKGAKIKPSEPRVWHELKHPQTGRFIGKYCPQTQQLLVVERGKRAVIELPQS